MEELEFNHEELEEDGGGYTPTNDPNDDVVKPTDDYIPLDDEHQIPTQSDVNDYDTTSLSVTDDELDELGKKNVASSDETNEHENDLLERDMGRKVCPTRHGCSGATDCDYCGGDYPF